MAKQTFTTGSVLTATQMNNLQANDYNWTVSQKTASYVLVAADAGTRIEMNAAGSTTVTVNTGLFTAGDSVIIQNIGAGTCTVTAGTATVNKATNASLALAQYQGGTLYFVSASSAIFFPFDVGSAASSSAVGVSLYNTTDQTVNNNATTLIAWNSETFDTDGFHDTATNNSRITIPSGKAGKYLLNVIITWQGNTTGNRRIIVYKNGAQITTNTTTIHSVVDTGTANSNTNFHTNVLDLAVGDYIQIYVFQNSGGALSAFGLQTGSNCQMMYLGA